MKPNLPLQSSPAMLWWTCFVVMVIGLTLPICVVEVPPLADYPNHFARAYVLAFGQDHSLLDEMYAPDWRMIPNLAMDLILPPLMKIMPPFVAGKIIIAIAVLLPTSGAIALSRVIIGRRTLWSLGAGLFAYNGLFLFGVINFHIAIGAALWSIAIWILLARRSPVVGCIVGALAAFICFIFHTFGLVLFLLLVCSYEFSAALPSLLLRERGAWLPILKRAALTMAAFLPTLVFYHNSAFASAKGNVTWRSPLHNADLLLPVFG